MDDTRTHEERVRDFLNECKEDDCENFKEVCDRYPVQSRLRKRIIRNREVTVGLLGLSPSRIPISVAERNDMETLFMNDEEG
jgi:hypothetical protein